MKCQKQMIVNTYEWIELQMSPVKQRTRQGKAEYDRISINVCLQHTLVHTHLHCVDGHLSPYTHTHIFQLNTISPREVLRMIYS